MMNPRKSRRTKRKNMVSRKASRKNTRRSNVTCYMRGGRRKSLRFAIKLKNNQRTIADGTLSANIRAHTQFYTNMFYQAIDWLLQNRYIKEEDATDFQFIHVQENLFELTFEFLNQRPNAEVLLDDYITSINEKFNKLTITWGDGSEYNVIAEFH
jgi:hypothetical protein